MQRELCRWPKEIPMGRSNRCETRCTLTPATVHSTAEIHSVVQAVGRLPGTCGNCLPPPPSFACHARRLLARGGEAGRSKAQVIEQCPSSRATTLPGPPPFPSRRPSLRYL